MNHRMATYEGPDVTFMLSGLRFKLLGLQVGCYCRVWWWHHPFQKFVIMAQLAHALGVLESEPAESETLSLQH